VLRGVVIERSAGREDLGRSKVRVLERRAEAEVAGGASPKMKNFMKAKISRTMESWPKKKTARAFILRVG